jgi:CPA1 family monovalent cation:H+ antiporter
MALFELTLILLLVAVALTALSRKFGVPYPALLALAGVGIAFVPFAPTVEIDPELAMVLFIAPALLDAAYDSSPRDMVRYRLPLALLALGAVLFTTAIVAFAGWAFAGLPVAAAVALGAIVAPPDAVAAMTVLGQFKVPYRITALVEGEGLLNDATALLVYRIAVGAAAGTVAFGGAIPIIALATIGSVAAGYLLGRLALLTLSRVQDPASGTVLQFASTFGVWLLADKAGLSAIITIVVYAITIARKAPRRMSARNRISSYSVWETAVFVLNVLAFVFMGLQARIIVGRMAGSGGLLDPFVFAAVVVAIVIVSRFAWVLGSGALARAMGRERLIPREEPLSFKGDLVVAWCGMRGLITLAAAFALPFDFPGRDPIVLAAFSVVLATLVLQGVTLRWLLAVLKLEVDGPVAGEVSKARVAIMDAAMQTLAGIGSDTAGVVRAEYQAQRAVAENVGESQGGTEHDALRLKAIKRQRDVLEELRAEGTIGDQAYHALEEELDWAELAASPRGRFQPLNTTSG